MVIDLFKSDLVRVNMKRASKQIETRKFKIDGTVSSKLSAMDSYFSDKSALQAYKGHLESLYNVGRQYSHIGIAGCDNLFELEALGIGEYTKGRTIIIDFSDKLDYLLHRITGCNPEVISSIENYHDISYALLNQDFRKVASIQWGVFFGVCPELDQYFANQFKKAETQSIDTNVQISLVIYTFCYDLLVLLSNIKDYTINFVGRSFSKRNFVYRSKSYSSVLASSDINYTDHLILRQDGYCDCEVDIECYKPFEYLIGRHTK